MGPWLRAVRCGGGRRAGGPAGGTALRLACAGSQLNTAPALAQDKRRSSVRLRGQATAAVRHTLRSSHPPQRGFARTGQVRHAPRACCRARACSCSRARAANWPRCLRRARCHCQWPALAHARHGHRSRRAGNVAWPASAWGAGLAGRGALLTAAAPRPAAGSPQRRATPGCPHACSRAATRPVCRVAQALWRTPHQMKPRPPRRSARGSPRGSSLPLAKKASGAAPRHSWCACWPVTRGSALPHSRGRHSLASQFAPFACSIWARTTMAGSTCSRWSSVGATRREGRGGPSSRRRRCSQPWRRTRACTQAQILWQLLLAGVLRGFPGVASRRIHLHVGGLQRGINQVRA